LFTELFVQQLFTKLLFPKERELYETKRKSNKKSKGEKEEKLGSLALCDSSIADVLIKLFPSPTLLGF
jgi:hypothetical protein